MSAFLLRRLWQMVPTMAGVVLLVFLLFNWVGGDPAYILAGKMSDDEAVADMVSRFEQLTEAWLAARGRKAA